MSRNSRKEVDEIVEPKMISIFDWFKEGMFYQYGLVYIGARMLNIISANMLQFYLVYILKVNKENSNDTSTSIYQAVFPLLCFISAILTSSFMGTFHRRFGRKNTFSIGVVL